MFRYPLFPFHYSSNSYFFCFCSWVIQFHGVLAYLVENTYIHTHTDIYIYMYTQYIKLHSDDSTAFDSHCTQQDLFQFPPFWWLWLPSLIVRSLPLLFLTRSTLHQSCTQSVSHAAATHPQNSTYCLSPENKKLWSKQSSFLLSKVSPSWTFPSLDVGRMKKKFPWGHMQRKGCRHRLTNILLPAFYWLFFQGCGWDAGWELLMCRPAWGFHTEALRGFHRLCLSDCLRWCTEQGKQSLEVGFPSSLVTP